MNSREGGGRGREGTNIRRPRVRAERIDVDIILYVGTSNSKKNFGIVSKVPRLVKAGYKFMRVNKNRLFQGKQRGKRGNKINPVDGG